MKIERKLFIEIYTTYTILLIIAFFYVVNFIVEWQLNKNLYSGIKLTFLIISLVFSIHCYIRFLGVLSEI